MKYKLVVIFILIFLTSCAHRANVRWRHPVPSGQLMIDAMMEIQGLYPDNPSDKITIDQAIEYLSNPNDITAKTPEFKLVTIEEDESKKGRYLIHFLGVNHSYHNLTVLSRGHSVPNLEHFVSYAFMYSGYIDSFAFATPHMQRNGYDRGSLIMLTTPITPYRVYVLYDNNDEIYEFDAVSENYWRNIFGRVRSSFGDSFNGQLFVDKAITSNGYSLYGPY